MRKITFASVLTFLAIITFAQPPQALKYQTVVRDGAGDILQNQAVSLRMSIRESTAYGPIAYRETHSVTTNEFGLVSIEIYGNLFLLCVPKSFGEVISLTSTPIFLYPNSYFLNKS